MVTIGRVGVIGAILIVTVVTALPAANDHDAEAAAIMAFGGSIEDVELIMHPHPTLSEAVREAALGVDGRMIHM